MIIDNYQLPNPQSPVPSPQSPIPESPAKKKEEAINCCSHLY
ncbi:MAG: hypothetical protein ACRCT1_06520 [Microcoleaceae cyanobacterium]